MDRLAFARGNRCACGNIRRAARSVTQYYDSYLKPSGIRSTQLSVLLSISLNDGITINELAELLVMDQTTVTRNVSILEERGYVISAAAANDGRKRHLAVTDKGTEKLEEVMPLWDAAQSRLEADLGPERFRDMLKLVNQLIILTK